jgi:predicted DCC family thiol-disulfide oxidoreductase YuxK
MPSATVKPKHLLFYDGSCGLCDHAVQFVLKRDPQGLFVFAPLQGSTAKSFFPTPPEEDSLILIEDYASTFPQKFLFGQGAFRVLWLMGGFWALPGLFNFLPPFLYDWGYRLVAENRHKIFSQTDCKLPTSEERQRFLP